MGGQSDPLTGETVTVSAGLAIFPKHGATPNGLFRRADLAVYGAKQLGRDRTAIYGAEVNAVVSNPMAEGAVYAGGDFTHIGGQARNFLAKLTGSTGTADLAWNPAPDSSRGGVVELRRRELVDRVGDVQVRRPTVVADRG